MSVAATFRSRLSVEHFRLGEHLRQAALGEGAGFLLVAGVDALDADDEAPPVRPDEAAALYPRFIVGVVQGRDDERGERFFVRLCFGRVGLEPKINAVRLCL